MRIGALCVTNRRPHMFGIAVAAFADQTHQDKRLVTVCNSEDSPKYLSTLDRLSVVPSIFHSPARGYEAVCPNLDLGCEELFRRQNCDVVVMWDDDDWKHSSFMSAIEAQFSREPFVEESIGGRREVVPERDWLITGYKFGHYVNARHLWAVDVGKMLKGQTWGFWGASLALRREAWEMQRWSLHTFPGQDPAWAKAVGIDRWAPPVDDDPYKMLSFCHCDNVFQHWRGGGFDLKPWLRQNMTNLSLEEIFRVREWFIANNIEPPQCDRDYE